MKDILIFYHSIYYFMLILNIWNDCQAILYSFRSIIMGLFRGIVVGDVRVIFSCNVFWILLYINLWYIYIWRLFNNIYSYNIKKILYFMYKLIYIIFKYSLISFLYKTTIIISTNKNNINKYYPKYWKYHTFLLFLFPSL